MIRIYRFPITRLYYYSVATSGGLIEWYIQLRFICSYRVTNDPSRIAAGNARDSRAEILYVDS